MQQLVLQALQEESLRDQPVRLALNPLEHVCVCIYICVCLCIG